MLLMLQVWHLDLFWSIEADAIKGPVDEIIWNLAHIG